jgi:hypothetical protein
MCPAYRVTTTLLASTGTMVATGEGELGVPPLHTTEQSNVAKVKDWFVWTRMPPATRASSSTVPYLGAAMERK